MGKSVRSAAARVSSRGAVHRAVTASGWERPELQSECPPAGPVMTRWENACRVDVCGAKSGYAAQLGGPNVAKTHRAQGLYVA
jgi:hypothetical protein